MSDTRLRECPICGHIAEMRTHENFYYIQCSLCGLRTQCFFDENRAIKFWNTRRPIDKIVEHLEELRDDAEMHTGSYEDYDEYEQGKAIAFEEAIKIIKAGGKYE